MTFIDINNAYFSIRNASEHHAEILKFLYEDELSCFTCLLMACLVVLEFLPTSCSQFLQSLDQNLGTHVYATLMILFMLRDILINCLQVTQNAVKLIIRWGFKIHPEKSATLLS